MHVNIKWHTFPEVPPGSQLLAIDVEGYEHSPRLVQFAYGDTAYLLDPKMPTDRTNIIDALNNKEWEFCSHSSYDVNAAKYAFGVDLSGRSRDTMLLACLAWPGERYRHGLKFLSTKLIDCDLEEAEKALYQVFKETYGGLKAGSEGYVHRGYHEMDIHHPAYELYSALDPIYCLRLYHLLKTAGVARVSGRTFFRAQKELDVLNRSAQRGIKVDRDHVEALLPKELQALEEASEATREATGYPARSVKIGGWLEERGVEFPERTEAGAPKLDKVALKVLVPRYQGSEVGAVLEARQRASSASNRVANLRNFLLYSERDGFVHPTYKSAAAATGRMSIINPAMQTLSKAGGESSLRSCFVSRPGFVFVGADHAGQELRVAAALSGDTDLAKRLQSGEDLHQYVADSVGLPRQVAKTMNFGLLYGAGPVALARQTGLEIHYEKGWDGREWPAGEAKEARLAWWSLWPQLQAWDAENRRKTKEHEWPEDCLELDSGRLVPVDFPHATSNYWIQSTGRDIIQRAILSVDRLMPDTLALVVHDELILECPEDRAEEAVKALNDSMTMIFETKRFDGIPMPLVAKAEVIGHRWGNV